MRSRDGTIYWSELMSRRPEAAMAFYERTVGWRFETEELGDGRFYHLAMRRGRPVAGVLPMRGPEFEGLRSRWLTYVAVGDLDETVGRIVASGGLLLSGPVAVARIGRLAVARDPTGGVMGLIEPADTWPGLSAGAAPRATSSEDAT